MSESMQSQAKRAYIASPYGFAEATRPFMYERLLPAVKRAGYDPVNPWDLAPDSQREIEKAGSIDSLSERAAALGRINGALGKTNADAIMACDIVVAVLDGVDVDSGVAAEIGFASALGKRVYGYRGDFRLAADNLGGTVNLQVEHFIRSSGGGIANTLDGLVALLSGSSSTKKI